MTASKLRRTIEWQLTKLRRVARGKTPRGLQRAFGTLAQEIILCARHQPGRAPGPSNEVAA